MTDTQKKPFRLEEATIDAEVDPQAGEFPASEPEPVADWREPPEPEAQADDGLRRSVLYVDRHFREPLTLAAVAAQDRYTAEDALEAITVEYDVLPPVLGVDEQAIDLSAEATVRSPRIYDDWPDDVQLRYDVSYGDTDRAFREADHVVSARVEVHRYGAVPLEPRAVVAEFDPGERTLTVRLATQVPHQMRYTYARIFGLPETDVRAATRLLTALADQFRRHFALDVALEEGHQA